MELSLWALDNTDIPNEVDTADEVEIRSGEGDSLFIVRSGGGCDGMFKLPLEEMPSSPLLPVPAVVTMLVTLVSELPFAKLPFALRTGQRFSWYRRVVERVNTFEQ